ncbi:MAG: hypothetical protein COW00_14215 [Bdellovibrio sp. CG12_big_fil_rev_8_21_14_0_65_39_13]|nr:MAG: hypothetical protein COW78_08040 [Bdellovibrio sp. CG22_combo_CG10-13_8_21_14_all_39_27]PIQ58768.1 MAG: hypothetical protein COW00_14215 [Bdellovibrio sp. CG12_big_fil_rev_8_21_14_0_65_39_13]PIR35551.1 MAG: hypothetical protein COV37_08745 [Bdellovibrio sp. CG11_big_fil_rev_8_21_14_0_20_39_38]PJB54305.1 MAG: hypothetical protein CO099_02305 [Bdellovibrio sp. CG_4_9_14_3_um_filter_39_7]
MKLSVLIPTWKRLEKCSKAIESILNQEVLPDQVIVVCRDIDIESQKLIQSFQSRGPIELVIIDTPGVIAAENKAISLATGDIICFLDDDAIAPPHWLKSIKQHFENSPQITAIGGPDFILHHHLNRDGNTYRQTVDQVGRVTWFGKIIGNHHQLTKDLIEVDILKGVNMAFRKEFVRPLDTVLQSEHHLGNGSHWELDLCFHVKKMGGRLFFDPKLDLVHDSNHTHFIHRDNFINNARNLTYVMIKHLSFPRIVVFFIYVLLIGNEQIYGLGKIVLQSFRNGMKSSLTNYLYSLIGLKNGIIASCRVNSHSKIV